MFNRITRASQSYNYNQHDLSEIPNEPLPPYSEVNPTSPAGLVDPNEDPPPYSEGNFNAPAARVRTEGGNVRNQLIRRVSLRDILNRNVQVQGVDASTLPPEGYSVSFEESTNPRENPVVEKVGDCLKIRSEALPVFISSNQNHFFYGNNSSGGSVVMGNMHFGGNMNSEVGSGGFFVNGARINQGNFDIHPAAPPLSPITVKVAHAVEAKSTSCNTVQIEDVMGEVKVSQSSGSKFIGRRLHHVDVRSSGASRATLSNIVKLNAILSGASPLTATQVSGSTKIEASDASRATLIGVSGDLEINASGASNVTAHGQFGSVEANASEASSITIHGQLSNPASTSSAGMSSVTINGELQNSTPSADTYVYYENDGNRFITFRWG